MDSTKDFILSKFPAPIKKLFSPISFEGLEEIRFRVNRPICLYDATGCKILSKKVSREELDNLSMGLCNHSVYAYLNEMKDGFLTIPGGHRVGFAGKCVTKDGAITGITNLSGINLRIAREFPGCALSLADDIRQEKRLKNVLLIAPPQCGKTTFLRDLARIFSKDYKVTVVDERSEIAGCADGVPQFDVGPQTDVLDRFPKASGMLLALRSLSPHIILTDELGDVADLNAIRRVCDAGCGLIASMHGENTAELLKTKKDFLTYFDLAVTLGRPNGIPRVVEIEHLR